MLSSEICDVFAFRVPSLIKEICRKGVTDTCTPRIPALVSVEWRRSPAAPYRSRAGGAAAGRACNPGPGGDGTGTCRWTTSR